MDAFTYPTGLLRNTTTGRFHPISFRPAPAPSEDATEPGSRYRSLGHHTVGFDTEAEAVSWIQSQPSLSWHGLLWEWDGVSVPAMTHWFEATGPRPKAEPEWQNQIVEAVVAIPADVREAIVRLNASRPACLAALHDAITVWSWGSRALPVGPDTPTMNKQIDLLRTVRSLLASMPFVEGSGAAVATTDPRTGA